MSDLQPQFLVTVPQTAAGTTTLCLPFDADLVGVSVALGHFSTATASTVDVQKNAASVLGQAQILTPGATGTIASSKISIPADSASVVSGVATVKTSVNSSATGANQNSVTSGVNIITSVVPADAVLGSFKGGVDQISVVSTLGTAATNPVTTLHFVRK